MLILPLLEKNSLILLKLISLKARNQKNDHPGAPWSSVHIICLCPNTGWLRGKM